MSKTVIALLDALIAADPTRPVLTLYDERTGERTELSGRTLDNWVAKTANLLVDGLGLGTGDAAAVRVRPHWQTAAVLLGCWTAGLTVRNDAPGGSAPGRLPVDAQVLFADLATGGPAGLATTGPAGPDEQIPDRYVLGLAPLGLPLDAVPPGWSDYVVEVRGHGDRYPGPYPGPADPAWARPDGRVVPHASLCGDAHRAAQLLGIPPGGRVLIDADAHPDPVEWLLAPLAAGASTILVVGADEAGAARIAAAERATPAATR